MESRKILVNADDFGISHEVNHGIQEAFRLGLVHRTTLMVNMPYADEAVDIAKRNGFWDKVGLHLNLVEGESLTTEIKEIDWIYSDEGFTNLVFGYLRSNFWLTDLERKAIVYEIEAQMEKFFSYEPFLRHMDSHQHIHNEFLIYPLVEKAATRHGFISMRIARNLINTTTLCQRIKLVYKNLLNNRIGKYFDTTSYFGSYQEWKLYGQMSGVTEIMVHPILRDNLLCDVCATGYLSMLDYDYINKEKGLSLLG